MTYCFTKELTTPHLRLRRFQTADAEAMFVNWASDPQTTKYLTWPAHASRQVTASIIAKWRSQYRQKDFYQWTIDLNGASIGTISVVESDRKTGSAEIGYCLGPSYWHKGYMSEALRAVMAFLFTQAGFEQLHCCHDTRNPYSGRVMQAAGMHYDGILYHQKINNQGICDVCLYSLSRNEFEKKPPVRGLRRRRQALSFQQCQTILRQQQDGVLALLGSDGCPCGVPLNYVYEDGRLYFHSALTGWKLEALRRYPRAGFTVVAQHKVIRRTLSTDYASIMAFGTCRILESPEEKRAALNAIAARFGSGSMAGRLAEAAKEINRCVIIEFTIEQLTGKQSLSRVVPQ